MHSQTINNLFELFSSRNHHFLVATTASRTLFSSPSSMAAPRCTRQRLSIPSSASEPWKTSMTASESESQTSRQETLSLICFYQTELISLCLICSNVLQLLNAFNYPEDSITSSNYYEVLNHLNQTQPHVIQGLPIQKCDLQVFLSQVSREHQNHRDQSPNVPDFSHQDPWIFV